MPHNDPQFALTAKARTYLDTPPCGGNAPWIKPEALPRFQIIRRSAVSLSPAA
jgi:hypothetical protein